MYTIRKVFIINIGTELLIGRTLNGNLLWLGSRIYDRGGEVVGSITVHDRYDDIHYALGCATARSPDAIITTGGLGPTYDDITMDAVARWLGRKLVLNPDALDFMQRLRPPASEESKKAYEKMAMLPEGSMPLFNYVGAAPGAIVSYGETRIFVLPGVPAEMRDMFQRYIEPFLGSYGARGIVSLIRGIYEAQISPLIAKIAKEHPEVYIKSHPGMEAGRSVLRVEIWTQSGNADLEKLYKEIEEYVRAHNGEIERTA
ncbi:MAG: competence/damage-inducible protein A [Nitrososphaeria archaeon]